MLATPKQLRRKLKVLFPKSSILQRRAFAGIWTANRESFNISTAFQENALIAQFREEVGPVLKPRKENLNYSCSALTRLFGYFKRNRSQAIKFGRCKGHRANQKEIASRAYANRIGNGNIKSEDGWKFKGGGYIQLTGRSNYVSMRHEIELAVEPGLSLKKFAENINTQKYGILAGMAFYKKNKMYECKNIDSMTRIVNKHTKSYQARRKHYIKIAYA